MRINSLIYKSLYRFLSRRYAKAAGKNLPGRLDNVTRLPLNTSQKEEVKRTWAPLSPTPDFRYWELYNSLACYDPLMVPDDLFVRDIIRTLNPIRMVYALQTKSNYSFLYQDLNKPTTVLRGINGLIYDQYNNLLDDSEVWITLKEFSETRPSSSFILKPTGSYGGIGVKKIDLNEELTTAKLLELLGATKRCFVCQEAVCQSPSTSRFNPSSLNTFRINTLNLNGTITSTNVLFRHGRKGSIVDNGGSGGICCGVDNSGQFTGEAYDTALNKYETSPYGVPYRDIRLSQVPNLVSYAIEAHRQYLPMMGHAAWDFGLDENDNPVFIEVNLGWPGIVIEQLACKAPIYADRTREVLDYVAKNKHKLTWTEYTGDWI